MNLPVDEINEKYGKRYSVASEIHYYHKNSSGRVFHAVVELFEKKSTYKNTTKKNYINWLKYAEKEN